MTDYLVTVCSACRTASCWHHEFVCDDYRSAGVIDLPASELRKLGLEHESNYSVEKLTEVYGVKPQEAA